MPDERDPGLPDQPDDGTAAEQPSDASTDGPPSLTLKPPRAPLRGSGSGLGVSEAGGMSEVMRRVRDAALAARQAASEQRPAVDRAIHDATERVQRAAEAARPEAERLARQAKAAAEAARPHLERAAHEAADFARDHEDELRSAATRAARFVAPAPLRPALDAMQGELQRPPSAPADDAAKAPPAAQPPASSLPASSPPEGTS